MGNRCWPFLALVIILVAGSLHAASESRLMRFPDIYENMIVFTHGGDLWTVPSTGGTATHLTSHISGEVFAKFSPDGKKIAFSASYDGNFDVYTISSAGGIPQRLTYHPKADVVLDWHPGGKKILFRSNKESKTNPGPRYSRLYTIDAEGGYPEALPLFEGELTSYSPDGKKIAYNRMAREFRTWKRYRGGMAQDIWLYDLEKNEVDRLTDFEGTDAFPMWHQDKIYFISDREHTMNIFCFELGSRKIRRITDFNEYDVKWPSLGKDQIVYENGGYLYVLDLNTEKSKKLEIYVPSELNQKRTRYDNVADRIGSFAISGKGKRAAFGARGDIFTVPAKKGEVRNLTRTAGIRERSPAFSPDGKWVAYLSDKTGEYEIYLRKPDGTGDEEKLTSGVKNWPFDLRWSPDSKKIIYYDQTYSLYSVDVEKKKIHQIDKDDWGDINEYYWSGDSKWIAYRKNAENGFGSIYLYSLDQDKSFQVTSDFHHDYDPVFDPGGKYLYFLSDRTINIQFTNFEFNYDFVSPTNLCVVTLQADTPSPLAPESDEVEVKEEEKKDKEDGKEKNSKSDEKDKDKDKDKDSKKEEGKKEEETLKIDLEGLENRIVALPIGVGNYAGLSAAEDKVFYVSFPPQVIMNGPPDFSQVSLNYYDLKERESKQIISGINGYDLSADGKKIMYSARGTFGIIDVGAGKKVGDGVLATQGLQMQIDPVAEWRQMFEEAWRLERDFFYVANMHGVDWDKMKKRYQVLLPHLTSRGDLNYIIGEMIAELNIGHAYVGGGDFPATPVVTGGFLGCDYEIDKKSGLYRFAKIYRGRNWDSQYQAPLSLPGINVKEGDYLLAVNGVELKYPSNPHQLLETLAGKQTVIKVSADPTGKDAKEYTVEPVGNDTNIRYADWVETNRRKVAEASGGKIGYIHVPNTTVGGLFEFGKSFYAQTEKEGMIVDVRYNSGGWIPDFFIERLGRKLSGMWADRYGKPGRTPGSAPIGHMACVINAYAGSGGDAFPHFFRQAGLGPLIGKRTWGGLVGINRGISLMDGGRVTMPAFGYYSLEGDWVIENEGVRPDIDIDNRPDLVVKGQDPQLEKAIEYLLEKIKEDPPRLPQKPRDPDKS
ncbi:MAG: PD40 domain-containing protein [Candidatus Krumholzibacteriota bacterium]|nr:PD40 domain-containing protein [Candidatus Krumholzibacteriota bacterium]